MTMSEREFKDTWERKIFTKPKRTYTGLLFFYGGRVFATPTFATKSVLEDYIAETKRTNPSIVDSRIYDSKQLEDVYGYKEDYHNYEVTHLVRGTKSQRFRP